MAEALIVAARRIAEAYGAWGKGVHAAGLNFGDCFAYDLAKEHACPSLYVGDDFGQTDISGVLSTVAMPSYYFSGAQVVPADFKRENAAISEKYQRMLDGAPSRL